MEAKDRVTACQKNYPTSLQLLLLCCRAIFVSYFFLALVKVNISKSCDKQREKEGNAKRKFGESLLSNLYG